MDRVTKKQLSKIHILKHQLGLTDEDYRTALESYGVSTSKDLNYLQATDLISKLVSLLPQNLKGHNHKNVKKKYDELGIRWNDRLKEYYATPKQLRMLEAMWMTSGKVNNKTETAFMAFVKRITGVDKIEWILMSDVKKIKKAIESLK